MKVLIGYYSRTGNTKKMAEAIRKGIETAGLKVTVKKIADIMPVELLDYQAIIFGSPTYYGLMAGEMKKLLDETVRYHGKLDGRVGGAFTSSGGIGCGGETTILSIIASFLIHGMVIIGESSIYHYGPVSIGAPNKAVVRSCIRYGEKIGALVKRLFH